MRPCRAARAGTQAPPLPTSIIFFHTILHKQNNHLHAIPSTTPTVHVQSAPTHLHQTTRCAITASHCTFDSPRQSHGVFTPHRIAHSIAPNHGVCHYPIGVILSIAQGWQVQRSLPWVTMQARRLPPWGLYFFSSHIITTRGK